MSERLKTWCQRLFRLHNNIEMVIIRGNNTRVAHNIPGLEIAPKKNIHRNGPTHLHPVSYGQFSELFLGYRAGPERRANYVRTIHETGNNFLSRLSFKLSTFHHCSAVMQLHLKCFTVWHYFT